MRVLRRRKIARNFPFGFDEDELGRYNAALVGQLAQLVEQRIENPRVRGSIPRLTTHSKSPNSFRAFSHLLYTPALVGLRRFASRALPLSFQRFGPLAASLFSVFL